MKSKKGFKRFVFICVGLICVGIIFTGIGFMLGGTPNISYERGVGFVSVQSVASFFNGKEEVINEDLDSFRDVKIYAGASNIYFVESDKYAVEYCYDDKVGRPEVSVISGTLVYKDRLYNNRRERVGRSDKIPMYVTVYYPAGTKFDAIYVDSDMGNLKIDGMDTGTLEASLDLGVIDFKKINALRLEIESDLGDINIKNARTGYMDISVDVGDIDISGELKGSNSISCDLGDVDIETTLTEQDYNYEIEVDLGEVNLSGRKISKSYLQNNGATNSMEIESSIGDIDVRFQ